MIITSVEEALTIVKQDGYSITGIPRNFCTVEVCLEAVKHNRYALDSINNSEDITLEVCLEAVKLNRFSLAYLPDKFIYVYAKGRYKLISLKGSNLLKGGCTTKTYQEWLDYNGSDLNDYDKDYLETVTKPFIKVLLKHKL